MSIRFIDKVIHKSATAVAWPMGVLAEGVGFEPTRESKPPTRLAGGRTKPLCDPSALDRSQYINALRGGAAYGQNSSSITMQSVLKPTHFCGERSELGDSIATMTGP